MKMLPVQLSLNPPLGLWSDVLWRCPPAPPSQFAELKTQLPASLPSDPRLWSREDVSIFLRFCEREFDLPKLDYELFQMNGKALCLLNRADFGHRCPGAGDVLHNVLQMLIIESHMMQWHLPNSPVTPTSRYPLSPHSHPPTPTWPPIGTPEQNAFHSTHLHQFMAPNSVTLSPPPSVDSQASSPPQNQEQMSTNTNSSTNANNNNQNCNGNSSNAISTNGVALLSGAGGAYGHIKTTSTSSSNHSDSDEESISEKSSNVLKNQTNSMQKQYSSATPPTTPVLKEMPQSMSQMTSSFVNSWSQSQQNQMHVQKLQLPAGNGGSVSAPTTPSFMQPVKREFFPENTEPNTNGRLLWDFLQQLLNDRNQKYSDLIAWKCRDTGVFKIVDPAGLAKLWGIQKNHLSMNYDKMSRALRYYYRVNILRKVQGERHCYQFLRNPTELKNIKNISLLRQTTATNNNNSNNNNNNNGGGGGGAANNSSVGPNGNASATNNHNNYQQSANGGNVVGAAIGNANSTNWQQGGSSSSPVMLTQTAPHSPQRPSSRSATHPMSLPAVAAVAAAAAAAYGPPPSSPLFMHAINGAFHYLQTNSGGVTPKSPALANSASDKFQFHALKYDNCNGGAANDPSEDIKPTDLSVGGGNNSYTAQTSSVEKRSYQSSAATGNDGCYPLIRNADGLTTIKLIRYSDDEGSFSSKKATEEEHMQHETTETEADKNSENSEPMEGQCVISNDGQSGYSNMVPTDLRK